MKHAPAQRLALIGFDDSDLIALDAFSGRWVGSSKASEANMIATIEDATPDKGDPATWVAGEVVKQLGGRAQVLPTGTQHPPDTVH